MQIKLDLKESSFVEQKKENTKVKTTGLQLLWFYKNSEASLPFLIHFMIKNNILTGICRYLPSLP